MKRWYVIQVYAGYEEAVKVDIDKRMRDLGLEELFGQVLIPSAKAKQLFHMADAQDQQLFPGYVLIEVEMGPETMRVVTSSPRALRFLGGIEPVPLTQKEVERIQLQITGEIAVGVQEDEFAVGSEIEIKEGPFAGFVGIVEKVDKENEKLTVMVSIFGRMTPVDLGFSQITR